MAGCCRWAGGATCAAGKTIDRVRVGFLGVKPKFQHTGAAAALYVEHFDTSARHARIKGGEMGGSWRPTAP